MGWLGYQEIFLIGIVALVVVGPRRMPEFYRHAGRLVTTLKRTAMTLQREMEQEVPYDDMDEISRLSEEKLTDEKLTAEKRRERGGPAEAARRDDVELARDEPVEP